MTLEAALVLPLFLSFLLAMSMFIRLAVAEMALQSAAAESTKMIATHLYPVALLLEEAKSKFGDTRIGSGITEVLDRAQSSRDAIEQSEQFVDDYAAWIPEPFVRLVQWEQEFRESAFNHTAEQLDEFRSSVLDPKLFAAMKPVVRIFADADVLEDNRMTVSGMTWPSFTDKERAYLGIELQYRFPLRLPFFNTEIVIHKQAYERVWLGI